MIAWLYWTSRLNVSFNFSDQDLSLLIQNKGSGSLSVAIAAPSFVKLEKTKIELQKKDEKKVHLNNNIFSLKHHEEISQKDLSWLFQSGQI